MKQKAKFKLKLMKQILVRSFFHSNSELILFFVVVEKSIRPKLLYKYLNERKKSILLIDMRLKSDYDQSHMKTSACIHIPADLMNGKGYEEPKELKLYN